MTLLSLQNPSNLRDMATSHTDTYCNFPVVKLGSGRFTAESTKMEQAERGGPLLLPARPAYKQGFQRSRIASANVRR